MRQRVVSACYLILILMLPSSTSASEMNMPYSLRKVESFFEGNHELTSRTLNNFDDTDNYGYDSLTSMFAYNNCTTNSDCRPWYYCNGTCCTCGEEHNGIMLCDQKRYVSALLSCHCITYDNTDTYVGACIYRCANEFSGDLFDPVYSEIIKNKKHHLKIGDWVNEFSCGPLYRAGTLCGSCRDNYSTIAYSYELKCMECPEGHSYKSWLKYLAAAYLPLTVFYFIIFFFKLNVTSSALHGFVFYSQAVAMPTNIRFILLAVAQKPQYTLPAKILLSVYGVWNLDFFRTLYPEFCLNTTTLGTIALDYAIAVYPLVLIMISFVLVQLHARNFRPVVCIWKPFHSVFTLLRRNWNMKTSVVDAYATLFLLSFSKILNVTFDLLAPTKLYSLHSDHYQLVVYNDANIKFFHREHMLPYGILGLAFLMLFIIPPVLLLLLYPCRCCRTCLNSLKLHRQCLKTFVSAFQGCYKDGSESGTRDYRYFASFYLMIRILLFIVYGITLGTIFFAFAAAIFLLFTLLVITVQPHKNVYSHYTKIDATFLLLLVIMCTIFLGINIATIKGHRHIETCFILAVIFGIVPFIYFAGVVIYTIHTQKKWDLQVISHYRAWRYGYRVIEDPDDDSSLPHRLIDPSTYNDCSVAKSQSIKHSKSTRLQSAVGTAY